MLEEDRNRETGDRSSTGDKPEKQPKYDWQDSNIPAGDAPPMPRWPLVISLLAWCGWLVFLVVMMVARMKTTPV